MPLPPVWSVFIPNITPGLGYGGAEYGYSPYGSSSFPRPPYPVNGGYGGAPYGYSPYGSNDDTIPFITGAVSLNGFQIEVFFSEEMKVDTVFSNLANYILTPFFGAPATVTSVAVGVSGPLHGATSLILTHTGTTLGGFYQLTITNLTDLSDNAIDSLAGNTSTFLALGSTPTYIVNPVAGDLLHVEFDQDMLPEAQFSPGIESISSYDFSTTYPIPLTINDITHPVSGDASVVELDVTGMTSASYNLSISPATAIAYDGTLLPDEDPTFSGVEFGIGSSTVGLLGLRLTKDVGNTYGWSFLDTSGKLLPGSSYLTSITLNPADATYSSPFVNATLGTFLVSDGAIQVSVSLNRVSGVDVLDIVSGGYSNTLTCNWSSGELTLSVLRNQKSDHYSILVNGTPVASANTASFTGIPTIAAGCRFTLTPVYGVTQFPILEVAITSSQTVFSSSWNFLHNVNSVFVGSSALTRSSLLTQHGPLTKDWGDATPATIHDIMVRVNNVPVDIADINPYIGEITPAIPIPLTTPGSVTVDIDYQWIAAPTMELVGLNTPGLILNKWVAKGRTATGSPGLGASEHARFPMGVALGPFRRPQPVYIGHRFLGFEKAYTASLNSPTTLLLNRSPRRISLTGLQQSCDQVFVNYEGTVTPTADNWELEGVDSGYLNGDGTYTVVDASSGNYVDGTATTYFRNEGFGCPSEILFSTRLKVDSYVADGVFTGVGFGVHDNFRLYLIGMLVVNGVKHLGFLRDPSRPHLTNSWLLGPSSNITITSSLTFTTTNFPTQVKDGTRFQILEGPQAGVYTIDADCGVFRETNGVTTVHLHPTTPFPADYTKFGNDTATIYYETPWDESLTTYRLIIDPERKKAQVFMGGSLSGMVFDVVNASTYPSQSSLLLPTGDLGAFFWGSLSRIATNQSTWSFAKYTVTPDATTVNAQGIIVSAEMNQPPESDANHEWFFTNEFGYSEIDSSGDTLLLKSTSGSDSIDLSFGYKRLEPFLTTNVHSDVDVEFKVETATAAAGDAVVLVEDGNRQVKLVTLQYVEGSTPYRKLVSLPTVSVNGLSLPTQQGWSASPGNTFTTHAKDNTLTTTQLLGTNGSYYKEVVFNAVSSNARIIEARFAVASFTANMSGDVGVIFGSDVDFLPNSVVVALTLRAPVGADPAKVILTSDGSPISEVVFDWTDSALHSYRLVADPVVSVVTLIIDDTVYSTTPLTLFDASTTEDVAFFGTFGSDVASVIEWDSFSVVVQPTAAVKRTLGVYLGGDESDIDSYKIPRTDTFTDKANSHVLAAVVEMDWRNTVSIRLHRDVNWGITVLRPDLPPPPYFTGDFATELTDPSAAWISVEYSKLPKHGVLFGSVAFGALNPAAITQQRWKQVRYRIYQYAGEDLISPHHMVLNQYNILHSGEYNVDVTPEVVQVVSLSSTLISLTPSHIYADRVFNVVVEGEVVSSDNWRFDNPSQTIILTTALSGDHIPVTVTFAPGKPITNTYLCSQPVLDSLHLLNDSTPPFAKSQLSETTSEVVYGSTLNDPNHTLNTPADLILNDPYKTVQFTDSPDAQFEQLQFCEVDDGGKTGLLSTLCDDVTAFEFSGSKFWEQTYVPGGPAVHQGSPSIRGVPFQQNSVLLVSGGMVREGVTNASILTPNYPSATMRAGTDAGSINREIFIRMRINSITTSAGETPLQDTFPGFSDNIPPSTVDGDFNPPGTPGTNGNGAAVAKLVDGNGLYSRLGPWGGLGSLTPASLLNGGSSPVTGFILAGGAPLAQPVTTVLVIDAA